MKLSKRYLYDGIDSSKFGVMSRFMWTKSLEAARKSGIIPQASKLKPEDLFVPLVGGPSEVARP